MTPTRLIASILPARSPDGDDRRRLWTAWSTLAGVGAGVATRALIRTAWQARTGHEPPTNPADPSVGWGAALAWSVGLGVGIGVARTVAQRGAARAWTGATGALPPGFGETSPGRAW